MGTFRGTWGRFAEGHGDVSRVPLEVGQGKRPHVPSDVPLSRLTSPCLITRCHQNPGLYIV